MLCSAPPRNVINSFLGLNQVPKDRKLSTLVFVAATIFACFIVCTNLGAMSEFFCQQNDTIAKLDAGSNRTINIYGKSCWELQRPLLYEVTDSGQVLSPKYAFDYDNGQKQHNYSLIYAEGKTVVGVAETNNSSLHIIAIYDFASGDSWPRLSKQKWRDLFHKLEQENPQLFIPNDFSE